MESPTQEDSLVFANESREQRSPDEPTQADQSTSPVFGNDSLMFSRELNASPLAARSLSRMFDGEDTQRIAQGQRAGGTQDDETEILKGKETLRGEIPSLNYYDLNSSAPLTQNAAGELHDTQVIEHPLRPGDAQPITPGGTQTIDTQTIDTQINDTQIEPDIKPNNTTVAADDTQLAVQVFPDPQAQGGMQVIPSDTQVIPTDTQNIPMDTQNIPMDTQVISTDTQIIPQDIQIIPRDIQIIPKDTQIIPTDTQIIPTDTQIIPRDTQIIPRDTQIIPTDTPSIPADIVTATQADKALSQHFNDTQAHGLTFPSSFPEPTQKNDSSQREHFRRTSQEPSPFVQRINIGVDSQKIEPTTQVANTQEETVDNYHQTIDLGCKSIFSSSQNEKRVRSDLSVVSHDESFVDSDGGNVYDDSLFRHKRKRQKISSPEPECKKEGSVQYPALASPVLQREAWSQSSSELEDFSHDVASFDLEKLPGGEGSLDFRMENEPGEPRELPALEVESGPALLSETVKNPLAVWAFFQFKIFPAKLVQSGETSSLVVYSDLKQLETRNSDLHLLDIRVGDVVEVAQRSGAHLVTGLELRNADSVFKCIRGYDTVALTKVRPGARKQTFHVPLYEVCMEADQWATHQQKFQLYCKHTNLVLENYHVAQRVLNWTHDNGTSPTKEKSRLFKGMLFFVTSIGEERKTKLGQIITQNGGTFVDDEIMHFLGTSSQRLAPFEFAALLSDSHSRSAKYLQALALGWPILADTFIERTLEDPSLLHHWLVFLLPAGFSIHVNAVTNLNIHHFVSRFHKNTSMSLQLNNNAELLREYTVLLMIKDQDEKVLEMCKFIFLTFGTKALFLHENTVQVDQAIRDLLGKLIVYDNGAQEYLKAHKKRKGRASQQTVAVVGWEWVVQCVISGYIWAPKTFIEV